MASLGSAISGAPAMESVGGNSPTEAVGANKFGNLKGLFKQQYSTCKHCGKQFMPKSPVGVKNVSDKQKEAAAINAAKGPKI